MRSNTIAKRYARALLDLGVEDGKYARYGQELMEFFQALKAVGEQAKVITSPAIPDGVRRKILNAILAKAALSPMVGNFIKLLMDKGRLVDLEDIVSSYKYLADEVMGVVQVSVVSATPLSASEIEAIGNSLNKFAERKVEITATEDPSIIGGLIAKMGDLTIDGSIRTQLSKLSEKLINL